MRFIDYPILAKLGGTPTEVERSFYMQLCARHDLDPHTISVDNRDLVRSVLTAFGWNKDGSESESDNSGWRRFDIIKADFENGEDPETSARKLDVNPKVVEFYIAFHQEAAFKKWQQPDFSTDPEDIQYAKEMREYMDSSNINL